MSASIEQWHGKVAIITGASSGIGAALAEKLVEAGLQVVGIARRVELVEELSQKMSSFEGKLHPMQCDVTKEEDILKAIDWTATNLGPISILINNAGVFNFVNMLDCSTEEMKKTFDTNLLGLFVASREVAKNMMENGVNGHIVNIGSVAGHVPPINMSVAYASSKHAVRVVTEALRKQFVEIGSKIKVTMVTPGLTNTECSRQFPGVLEKNPSLEVEDVANTVLFVLSTPPHVNIIDVVIRPVGERMFT